MTIPQEAGRFAVIVKARSQFRIKPPLNHHLLIVVWSFALGISYTFSPLYSSNQNHKFLIGLARAGFGELDRDWLVGTADPVPVFSLLVQASYCRLGEWVFYLAFLLLFIPYLAGVIGIFGCLGAGRERMPRLAFVAAIVFLHSHLFCDLSKPYIHFDPRELLIDGVAHQSLLSGWTRSSYNSV